LGRVRESIFNVLTNVGLVDTKVLDVFAGTGAMGLEALSRYASSAVFIDKTTGRIIRENAKKCHVEDQVSVLSRDVGAALRSLQGETFDYIFMDPPYRKGYINEVLEMIFACGLPAENAIIVAEHSVSEPPDMSLFEGKCEVWKEKKVGAIVVTYLLCRCQEGVVQ
jgi:16S rRNA (guanine966-N2)-methyltransferase